MSSYVHDDGNHLAALHARIDQLEEALRASTGTRNEPELLQSSPKRGRTKTPSEMVLHELRKQRNPKYFTGSQRATIETISLQSGAYLTDCLPDRPTD